MEQATSTATAELVTAVVTLTANALVIVTAVVTGQVLVTAVGCCACALAHYPATTNRYQYKNGNMTTN